MKAEDKILLEEKNILSADPEGAFNNSKSVFNSVNSYNIVMKYFFFYCGKDFIPNICYEHWS